MSGDARGGAAAGGRGANQEMEDLEFSEEDIQQQLSLMGYTNVPQHRLREFKRDLEELVRHDRSKSRTSSDTNTTPRPLSSASSGSSSHVVGTSRMQQLFTESRERFVSSDHGQQASFSVYGKENWPVNAHANDVQQYDPYSVYTVAPKSLRPTSAPSRMEALDMQGSPGAESSNSSLLSDESRTSSPDRRAGQPKKPAVRRKVLRKKNGESHVYVESSLSEAESDAVSDLRERLSILQTHGDVTESDLESEDTSSSSTRRPYSAHPFFTRDQLSLRPVRSEDGASVSHRPKSFIKPLMEHPHTRNLKKTDPVAKYFQYKQDWDSFKAPGEKNRKGLRWGIREQMLYKSQPPPKPQRIYLPNNYVVPTDKKRSALRWEVRHDLAKGNHPQTFFCPW